MNIIFAYLVSQAQIVAQTLQAQTCVSLWHFNWPLEWLCWSKVFYDSLDITVFFRLSLYPRWEWAWETRECRKTNGAQNSLSNHRQQMVDSRDTANRSSCTVHNCVSPVKVKNNRRRNLCGIFLLVSVQGCWKECLKKIDACHCIPVPCLRRWVSQVGAWWYSEISMWWPSLMCIMDQGKYGIRRSQRE